MRVLGCAAWTEVRVLPRWTMYEGFARQGSQLSGDFSNCQALVTVGVRVTSNCAAITTAIQSPWTATACASGSVQPDLLPTERGATRPRWPPPAHRVRRGCRGVKGTVPFFSTFFHFFLSQKSFRLRRRRDIHTASARGGSVKRAFACWIVYICFTVRICLECLHEC